MPYDSELLPSVRKDAELIFLSYASEDRETAKTFVRVFAARGWDVWWDRQLLPGQVFDAEIALNLAKAKCVVVLWSEISVQKRWVFDEAEDGAARGILVPVLINHVKIPFGFRRLQTAMLADWDGHEVDDPALSEFLTAIERCLNISPAPEPTPTSLTRHGRSLAWVSLALSPTIFVLGLMWVLVHREVATQFRLDAVASRIEFSIDTAEGFTKILESIPVRDVIFDKFSAFEIEPDRGEIADSALYDIASDKFPTSAWQPLTLLQSVIRFTPVSDYAISKVAIAGLSGTTAPAGVLDAVRIAPRTTFTLETKRLTADLR
jgi:hypothetical protein